MEETGHCGHNQEGDISLSAPPLTLLPECDEVNGFTLSGPFQCAASALGPAD